MLDSPIFCSNLINDQDMIRALGASAVPMPLFTDACFSGVGDEGPLVVAVERKKIGDLCQCINDGRFLFQLRACAEAGADVCMLIVEGRLRRCAEDGLIEVPVWKVNPITGKRMQVWFNVLPLTAYSRFDQYLTELEYLGGVIVKRSENVQETASIIKATHVNFNTAPDKHNSLKQIFKRPPPRVLLSKPSLVRRVAVELDGIGWELSLPVAKKFRSVAEMMKATETDWMELPGIGKKLARGIMEELHNERKG